ncbi:hypothetical protein DM02DRAFT_678143 [Periconia macrospinosa]|uniref:Zn(2)-C6 fungal-type domain-containing protein n=1 Tax=Periconia macrospinosa TaxID=97972 RepID=A0A2V1D235_9PLEO|nr:hypothetical protein DM02DRAFT_678143 [Periconia macrospinosa]
MQQTLRRSCDACARSKLRCDLQLPQCSRCQKRSPSELICVYANAPLSSSAAETATTRRTKFILHKNTVEQASSNPVICLMDPGAAALDPFDSYPQTRLPRVYVQRLIHHFLSNIAFQYYPLDLRPASNPFVVSWFPLALADPALFHVSLQTASLDLDLRAQRGFTKSDVLMADSVSLVRLKIEDATLAIQDETMNAVVALAAIELGKGNVHISRIHIDGVKSMVRMRGGIHQVKTTSPLTARMVSWVSMIAMQYPQFPTQDDSANAGEGIAPITQWHEAAQHDDNSASSVPKAMILDPSIGDILRRLRNLFGNPEHFVLTSLDFHDLTCFILHRLLGIETDWSLKTGTSEGVRVAIALYMLMLHGPSYYSHASLQYRLTQELRVYIEHCLGTITLIHAPLAIWLTSVGMVASKGSLDCDGSRARTRSSAAWAK